MSIKSVNLYGEEVNIGLLMYSSRNEFNSFSKNFFLDFQFISSSQLMSARRISTVTSASVLVRWEGAGGGGLGCVPVGGGRGGGLPASMTIVQRVRGGSCSLGNVGYTTIALKYN